jgi:hypothetical protein
VGTPEVRRWVVTGHIVSPRTPGDNPPSAVPRRTTDRVAKPGRCFIRTSGDRPSSRSRESRIDPTRCTPAAKCPTSEQFRHDTGTVRVPGLSLPLAPSSPSRGTDYMGEEWLRPSGYRANRGLSLH